MQTVQPNEEFTLFKEEKKIDIEEHFVCTRRKKLFYIEWAREVIYWKWEES